MKIILKNEGFDYVCTTLDYIDFMTVIEILWMKIT
jgi:hypothetical protein